MVLFLIIIERRAWFLRCMLVGDLDLDRLDLGLVQWLNDLHLVVSLFQPPWPRSQDTNDLRRERPTEIPSRRQLVAREASTEFLEGSCHRFCRAAGMVMVAASWNRIL